MVASLHWNDRSNSHFKPQQYLQAGVWKKYLNRYDWCGIKDNVRLFEEVSVFEVKNKISIQVFTHRNRQVILARKSLHKYDKVVYLFLVQEQKNGENKCHYVLIRDINLFLSAGRKHKKFACSFCCRLFTRERDQLKHNATCALITDPLNEVEHIFPEEHERLQFDKYYMALPVPWYVCYDFECFAMSPEPENAKIGANTTILNVQKPASFSMVLVMNLGGRARAVRVKYYTGENIMDVFFQNVLFLGLHST